jgi:hypothetical protein
MPPRLEAESFSTCFESVESSASIVGYHAEAFLCLAHWVLHPGPPLPQPLGATSSEYVISTEEMSACA